MKQVKLKTVNVIGMTFEVYLIEQTRAPYFESGYEYSILFVQPDTYANLSISEGDTTDPDFDEQDLLQVPEFILEGDTNQFFFSKLLRENILSVGKNGDNNHIFVTASDFERLNK